MVSWQLATKTGKLKIGIVGKEICTRSSSTGLKKQSRISGCCTEFCIPRSGIFWLKVRKEINLMLLQVTMCPQVFACGQGMGQSSGTHWNEPQILGWNRIPDSWLTLCLEPM